MKTIRSQILIEATLVSAVAFTTTVNSATRNSVCKTRKMSKRVCTIALKEY